MLLDVKTTYYLFKNFQRIWILSHIPKINLAPACVIVDTKLNSLGNHWGFQSVMYSRLTYNILHVAVKKI